MSLKQLQKSPQSIQNDIINECKAILNKKFITLFFKRGFDIFISFLMILLISPVLLICSICIACQKDGPVLFKQTRVGVNGKEFKILKFRTMVDKNGGTGITVNNDDRITKIGGFLRKYRLDELPQLFNVFIGDMSFVGPRPEVTKFVNAYKDEWYATLLVKPGITCASSIYFADEAELLESADNAEECYINTILPEKCQMNIEYIKTLSFFNDIKIMFNTVKRVLN